MVNSVVRRCPACLYEEHFCICHKDKATPADVMSKREWEMLQFGGLMCEHVGEYTVPQYGDLGEDNVTNWSSRDCEVQIEKYVKRFKSNQRGFEEAQRDLKKICHYSAICHNKRIEEQANDKATEVE